MQQRDNLLARAALAWVAVGHLVTGIPLFFSGEGGLAFVARLYGATFEPHAQAVYLARPLGVFMLALGLLQLNAIRDPWRFRAVLDVTILVFVLRQIQRVFYAPGVFVVFGLTPTRHWIGTGFFLAILVWLIVARLTLRPRPDRPAVPPGTGDAPSAPHARDAQQEEAVAASRAQQA
jgi:hypothetical protein